MYRIGLDIGTTSVGWSVLNTDLNGEPNRIIDMGVRIFDAAEHPKDGSSLAAPRREARGARRRNRRHRHRMDRIKNLLQRENIISKDELINLYNSNGLTDVYKIRYEAIERLLTKEELARVLIHIAQRRGFKSNRKNEDKKSDAGKLLTATNENVQYMEEKGYLTVGEMLYKDEKYSNIKRNKGGDYSNTFLRQQIIDEINIIFEKQKSFGNKYITDDFIEKYLDIVQSQRDFDEGPGEQSPYSGNQIEKMVGNCTFEKNEKRGAKACYTFEYFNLLQKVNNIRIISDNNKRFLSDEERKTIIELCHKTEKVDYNKIRKELGLSDKEYFSSLSYGNQDIDKVEKTKFQYLAAYHEMRRAFDKLYKGYIEKISIEKRDVIGTVLTYYKTDEKIISSIENYDFSDDEKQVIINMKNFSKVGNLSLKAMRKITPYLEIGMTYDKACIEAGYDFKAHKNENTRKYLPKLPDDIYEITSPVVKRSINQTIRLVNALIRKYGSPAMINIELARDMSKSFAERKVIEKQQKENADNNQKVYNEIKNTFGIVKPSGQDIIKYRLWQEQQGICLYTNTPIKAELLFTPGYCEIDHIIPYSISFDDRYTNKALVIAQANREKGNRIPMDYVKSKDDFIGIVNAVIKNRAKRQKLLKVHLTDEEQSEMKQRSLQDTQFITRFMANYIRDNLAFDETYTGKQKVISVNGAVTSYMRKRWGITKIREDGDLHHSVDAVVVACVSQGTIQKVTKYSRYRENYYKDRDADFKDEKFPLPWPEFKTELEIRTSKKPQELLNDILLPNYQDMDLSKIKPIFVSRRERKKKAGQAHKETIRSKKDITLNNVTEEKVVTKTLIQDLKIKDGEIENYYNPSSDKLLYNLLKEKLIKADGDGKKAFPEGYVYKPTPKGGISPKVNKVKTYETSSLNVSVNNGVAGNGDMVRIDLYKVENEGYYFVPIYVSDLVKDKLPNKACVAHKNYEQWKIMDDKDFLYSVYPNDLLLIKSKKEMKFSKTFKDAKIQNEYLSSEEFVYYSNADIASAAIKVIINDNSYFLRGLGIKTLKSIEKYNVDILGNKYKADIEIRK